MLRGVRTTLAPVDIARPGAFSVGERDAVRREQHPDRVGGHAVVVDTSDLSIDEVLSTLTALVNDRIGVQR